MDAFEAALAALALKFRERCAREGPELRALIDAGELYSPRTRHLLHGLAGTGGSFGFDEVSATARHIEVNLEPHAVEPVDLEKFFAAVQACADGATG